MNARKFTQRTVFTAAAFTVALGLSVESAQAAFIGGTYGFTNATAGQKIVNNDNWTIFSADRSDATIENTGQPTGFSGNYFDTSVSDQIVVRPNDANFSYSIPDTQSSLTMSFLLQTQGSADGTQWIGPSVTGGEAWRFGKRGANTWGFRDLDVAITELGNGTGDGLLDGTVRTYKVTVNMDLTANTLDFLVDNLDTAAGPETIASGVSIGNFGNPSDFDRLWIRSGNESALIDNISIVPEPASLALLGLGGLMLVGRRQRKA